MEIDLKISCAVVSLFNNIVNSMEPKTSLMSFGENKTLDLRSDVDGIVNLKIAVKNNITVDLKNPYARTNYANFKGIVIESDDKTGVIRMSSIELERLIENMH